MVGSRGDDGRSRLLVHQLEDFLADGTEVFSNGASSDGRFIGIEVSPADEDCEDAEVSVGPLDPNEIATDAVGVAEGSPMVPLRGLCLSGRFNHGEDAGFLCKAQCTEESIALRGWHSLQGRSCGKWALK